MKSPELAVAYPAITIPVNYVDHLIYFIKTNLDAQIYDVEKY